MQAIISAVLNGDAELARREVLKALRKGETAERILKHGLIAAMQEVGLRFEQGEFFIPEMLIVARAMQTGLKLLKPHLVQVSMEATTSVAIGTVSGDIHDIGKNLVAMMLEGTGFRVEDLGVDVPAQRFVAAVHRGARVVALSALLTTTMPNMREVIAALKAAGVRKDVCVLVGGAPVTQDYAERIGADLYAPDAASAARRLRQAIRAR